MIIVLVHEVSLQDDSVSETLFKAIDSNFRSNKEDVIEDPAFVNYSYEPIVMVVKINYSQNECHLYLSELILESDDPEDLTAYVTNAMINGWSTEEPIF
ncbi:hypothetical protein [Bacillus mycoides]|uniref:hypothetical protein n=1 Tax=Bacillus mycoides TaxID=1405 RepID=UPI002E1B524E|nr:hypothetical protein [Bacillus mycoides]